MKQRTASQQAIFDQMQEQEDAMPIEEIQTPLTPGQREHLFGASPALKKLSFKYDPVQVGKYRHQEEMIRLMSENLAKQMENDINPMRIMGYDKGRGDGSVAQRMRFDESGNNFVVEDVMPDKLYLQSQSFSSTTENVPRAWGKKLLGTVAENATTEKIKLDFSDGEFV